MHLLCRMNRHNASDCEVWNDGHFFSFCDRCGCDLVRRPSTGWQRVRPPLRLVWKRRQPFDLPWISKAVSKLPADDVPICAEWRALILLSPRLQDVASPAQSPFAGPCMTDSTVSNASDTATSAAMPMTAPAAMSVG